ncbi:hypothetical protein AMTRI_Chr08g166760 [Amborella trichopoda]
MDFEGFDSNVLSGGLWVIWHPNVVQKDDCVLRHISILFSGLVDGFKWCLTNVYGPNRPDERAQFLDELNALTNFANVPWCIGGDFNDLSLYAHVEFFHSEYNKFLDIPSIGAAYTWSNHALSNPTLTRLDRFLVTNSFLNKFPNLYVKALVKITFDHAPLLLNSVGMKFGPSLFRMDLIGNQIEALLRLRKSFGKIPK